MCHVIYFALSSGMKYPYYSSILGWSAFAGVAVVIVAYILNYPLAKYNIYVCLAVILFRRLSNITADHETIMGCPRSTHESRQRAFPERPLSQILWLGCAYIRVRALLFY